MTDGGPDRPADDAGGHRPDAGGRGPDAGGRGPDAGGRGPDAGGRGPDAGGRGRADDGARRGEDPAAEGGDPLTAAEVERLVAALDEVAEHAGAATPARVALVMTPVASAPALAGLCAMAGLDVGVVPSSTGAVAALETPARPAPAEWDISELLGAGGAGGGFPPEAEELAATLSRLTRAGVVLLVADLSTDVGIESGLSGHLSARRYAGGEPEGDVPAGLVLAGADQVVEDLLLGRTPVARVRGYQRSGDLPRWKAAKLFTRGLKRKKP